MSTFTTTLSITDLAAYMARQLNTFFPDKDESATARSVVGEAVERLEHCIRHVRMKGWWGAEGPRFNHLHTDQYAVFLYYLANTAFQRGEESLAAKAYALNKALHGLDAFYEVALPAIFALVHPVGTVLGRATYSDYFCAYQNVTIGSGLSGNPPKLGQGVVLYAGARVIGQSVVGNNCLISSGCTVIDSEVEDGRVVWGKYDPKSPDRGYEAAVTRHNVIADIFKDV